MTKPELADTISRIRGRWPSWKDAGTTEIAERIGAMFGDREFAVVDAAFRQHRLDEPDAYAPKLKAVYAVVAKHYESERESAGKGWTVADECELAWIVDRYHRAGEPAPPLGFLAEQFMGRAMPPEHVRERVLARLRELKARTPSEIRSEQARHERIARMTRAAMSGVPTAGTFVQRHAKAAEAQR